MKFGLHLLLLLIFLKGDLMAQTGINWSPATTVSAPSYYNNHPRITIDRKGDPMVIWGRNTDHALFFSRWTGSGFGMPTQLNPSGMAVATDSWQGPQIASHGDTVYVVFKQFPEAPDSAHIYCTRSFDGGISFMAPVRVSFIGDSICRFPTVTTDALGNPIVGFMKFDSNFGNARWVVSVSQDFGNSFLPDVLASGWSSPTSTVCDCCPGSITSNGNTVAMLYRDNDNDLRDTWAGLSHDGGQTFTEGMNIDQNNWMISNCPATGPDGFIIGDTLYSVFMNGAGGAAGVYFSTSSISAASGSASWQLNGTTPGLTYQNFPRTANYNNAVAVAWKQVVGSSDQCVIRFTNDIHSGLPSVYDTVDLANITNVDVAVSDSTVFVVWQGNNNGSVNFRKGSYTPLSSGISDIDYKSARIYPNPVTGNTVSIQSNTPFRNPNVAVYNNMGQPVVSTSSVLNDHILDIDISSLQQGFFNLEITDGHTIYRARFIRL